MEKREYSWLVSAPFLSAHAAAVVGVAIFGWSWRGFALAMTSYVIRMFGVTMAYHRYFAHRSYRTSRWFQFCLAVLAESTFQKGVLWWAAHHRDHHKYSDTKLDPHSWKADSFWWSHIGWILSRKSEPTDLKKVPDLARFPELRWLDTHHLVPGIVLSAGLFVAGGWFALFWGSVVSTVLLWHGTFAINSFAHWLGRRRYETSDNSKNSIVLAILVLGEGWHNNHHYYPRSTRAGFFWWEFDITYYVLRALAAVGIVWDLHEPPAAVRAGNLEAGRPKALRVPIATAKLETSAEAAAE